MFHEGIIYPPKRKYGDRRRRQFNDEWELRKLTPSMDSVSTRVIASMLKMKPACAGRLLKEAGVPMEGKRVNNAWNRPKALAFVRRYMREFPRLKELPEGFMTIQQAMQITGTARINTSEWCKNHVKGTRKVFMQDPTARWNLVLIVPEQGLRNSLNNIFSEIPEGYMNKKQLAEHFGVTSFCIAYRIREEGIPTRTIVLKPGQGEKSSVHIIAKVSDIRESFNKKPLMKRRKLT